MKFENVKPGMVFRQDIGGEYGSKFWFVYQKTSDKFITVLFHTRKSSYGIVTKVNVTKELYEDPDYQWRDREPVEVRDLLRYKKKLIPAIFEEFK